MADKVSIGELVVTIGGDAAPLEASGKAGEKSLKAFQATADATATGVRAAVQRIAGEFLTLSAVLGLAKKAFNEIIDISKLSDASGIGVEALSRLKYAAQQQGVAFEDLRLVVAHYSMVVAEMARNPASAGAEALSLLGIKAKNASGEFKNFDEILPDLITKFQQYGDGVNKAALFTTLAGREWKDIAPLLRGTAAELQALKDKATDVIKPEDVAKAKELRIAYSDLTAAVTKLAGEFVLLVAGPLGAVVRSVASMVESLNSWRLGIQGVEKAGLEKLLQAAQLEAAGFAAELERMKTSSTGMDLVDKLQLGVVESNLRIATARVNDLQAALDKFALPVNIAAKGPQAPDPGGLIRMREDLDDFINRLNGMPVLLTKSFSFDTAPFETAMEKVKAATEAGALTARQAANIKLQLQRQEQDAILGTATLAASTLTAVFAKSKLAAIGSAIINTAVGITKALALEGPLGWAQAALIAASGAAQIAAISSASASGGGSAPSAAPPAAPQTATAAAPNDSVLRVEGISSNSLFSGDSVRDLAKKLLDFQRDGGQVVLQGA